MVKWFLRRSTTLSSGDRLIEAMKVALTGVSSFTGCHIARALVDAGFEVCAFLTQAPDSYSSEIFKKRLSHSALGPNQFVYDAPFGSDVFIKGITKFEPEIFINHGADIKGYRSPDFDVDRSVSASLRGATEVIKTLSDAGCRRVLHSGTVFEPIDGLDAISPYGQAKYQVSQELERLCTFSGLGFSKIYIANPIGPFENEDRMIPVFVKQWLSGVKPNVSAPRVIWDHVPAPWLAKVYLDESKITSNEKSVRRPSGFQIDLQKFVELFVSHCHRVGLKLDLSYLVAENPSAPTPRLNIEPCSQLNSHEAINQFFETWIKSLFKEQELQ